MLTQSVAGNQWWGDVTVVMLDAARLYESPFTDTSPQGLEKIRKRAA